jgi:hypothetical protein
MDWRSFCCNFLEGLRRILRIRRVVSELKQEILDDWIIDGTGGDKEVESLEQENQELERIFSGEPRGEISIRGDKGIGLWRDEMEGKEKSFLWVRASAKEVLKPVSGEDLGTMLRVCLGGALAGITMEEDLGTILRVSLGGVISGISGMENLVKIDLEEEDITLRTSVGVGGEVVGALARIRRSIKYFKKRISIFRGLNTGTKEIGDAVEYKDKQMLQ